MAVLGAIVSDILGLFHQSELLKAALWIRGTSVSRKTLKASSKGRLNSEQINAHKIDGVYETLPIRHIQKTQKSYPAISYVLLGRTPAKYKTIL